MLSDPHCSEHKRNGGQDYDIYDVIEHTVMLSPVFNLLK